MTNQKLSIFSKFRIIDMIPDIVGVHFLLTGIDLAIAMDDYISLSFFLAYFMINILDMLMQKDRDINTALPGVSSGVSQILNGYWPV